MDNKVFTRDELRCLKAAVDLYLATQDLWNNEYVVTDSPYALQESDISTLERLSLKLTSA